MLMMADYFKETQGYEYAEISDAGFALYRLIGPECHVGHMYIVPEKRSLGMAQRLGDLISDKALDAGCKHLSCVVELDTPGASRLVKIYLEYGYQIIGAVGNSLLFKKDL